MTRRALVTGGAGFIGSHLVDRLTALGDMVTVVDDLSSGSVGNLQSETPFVQADVRDADLLHALIRQCDVVFHLAARVSVQDCIDHWDEGHRVNLGGTLAVFQAARRAGGVPVVYASSAAVYGDQGGRICREDDLPRPISPYAADKLASEHQARAMEAVHGLASVGLRFFNVYGPRQDPASPYAGVITRLCANRLAGRAHTIFGDGLQSRDFVHVADVVDTMVSAAEFAAGQGGASVFNVCTGRSTTLLGLARCIDQVAGQGPTPVQHRAARPGDIRHSQGDPTAARRSLGLTDSTDLVTGLRDLLDAMAGPVSPSPARR